MSTPSTAGTHRVTAAGAKARTERTRKGRSGRTLIEMIRLVVVVLVTLLAVEAAGSPRLADDTWSIEWLGSQEAVLVAVVLGAAVGYVLGGVLGRFSVDRMDAVESRLADYSLGEIVAGLLGALAGLVVGAGTTWPLLLVGTRTLTLPLAVLVVLLVTGTGLRIGIRRGGDLLRTLGVSGRLPSASPTRGARAKVVDTSALIDGRLLDVCRSGFFDGVLVLPQFVLYELQGLADAGDDERRRRGRRGLDVLAGLQRSSGVTLEVTEQDYPEIAAVDAKLVAMARDRHSSLVTVDSNLERVAEVQGVRVLNLHTLSETLRPPVLPGDDLEVLLVKPGKERGQAVGYLADGTMVVVEDARDRIGREERVEVTSILSTAHGRMVFAHRAPAGNGALAEAS